MTVGYFITFEGIDGCGKTTVLRRVCRGLQDHGVNHVVIREPGGTKLGERLRTILLDPEMKRLDPWSELLLYTASRVQQSVEVVCPALADGKWVLADRFVDATLAYQGYGRGLGEDKIRALHDWATGGLWPDCTVLLDCDPACAKRRLVTRDKNRDRLERCDMVFYERVRRGYLQLAALEPGRFLVVDAMADEDSVFHQVWGQLCGRYLELNS